MDQFMLDAVIPNYVRDEVAPPGVPVRQCSSTHVAINSLSAYEAPRKHLLEDMRQAGVPMDQVRLEAKTAYSCLCTHSCIQVIATIWHSTSLFILGSCVPWWLLSTSC